MQISIDFLHLNNKSNAQYQRVFGKIVSLVLYSAPAFISPWLAIAMVLMSVKLHVNNNEYSLIQDDILRDGFGFTGQVISFAAIISTMFMHMVMTSVA